MGARNVSAAFAMWAHLGHAPFRLLVGMALQSLDQTSKEGRPPRVWYGGEDALVEFMGGKRSTAYRALGQLREVGAIESVEVGRSRHRAVYKLALDPLEPPTQGLESETQKGPKSGTHKGPRNGTRRVPIVGPLGTTEGGTEESRGGDISSQAFVSPAAGADSSAEQIDLGTAQQIVGQALSIEAAAARIRELAADGADYTAAYITLAHQLQEGTPA